LEQGSFVFHDSFNFFKLILDEERVARGLEGPKELAEVFGVHSSENVWILADLNVSGAFLASIELFELVFSLSYCIFDIRSNTLK